MTTYMQGRPHRPVRKPRRDYACCDAAADDNDDDDVKLLDLKEKWAIVKPKQEYLGNQCRTCSSEEGCISIYEQRDEEGVFLAIKLKLIGGIEIERTDALSSHICLVCFRELDAAYKFRRRCQDIDKELRGNTSNIKIEIKPDINNQTAHVSDGQDMDTENYEDTPELDMPTRKPIKMERPAIRKKKKKVRRLRYDYYKICEVCGKHTKNLLSHLDTHANDKGYSCEVCEKRFKFKSGLIIHRAVHDPTPKKTCEVCGKTFHILAQYRRHFVYHANERKYGCETCGKRFNTMDILKVHNRSHTDERPFSCTDCGKTFRTAGCVSRHKKIVHRNIKQ